ncbi:helix-turn-helix domain-containing protein [Aquimarina sp. 2201CG1-2-11]
MIAEDLIFLLREHSKSPSSLTKDRIKALIYIKEGKYAFQSDIAQKLGRTEKTVRGWLQKYSQVGFSGLTTIKSGGNNTKVLSDNAKIFIAEKLTDPTTTMTSYIELKLLIAEELEENVPYFALYAHCRRKHKSKLKVARKSHYKKDPKAEELFKKS